MYARKLVSVEDPKGAYLEGVNKQKITDQIVGERVLRKLYDDDQIEVCEKFFCLYLNRNNEVIGHALISQGSATGTMVEVKFIIKFALDMNAQAIVLSHNHPSGKLSPIQPDITITNKIKQAAKLFDIQLLDHIIITKESSYSSANNGHL